MGLQNTPTKATESACQGGGLIGMSEPQGPVRAVQPDGILIPVIPAFLPVLESPPRCLLLFKFVIEEVSVHGSL